MAYTAGSGARVFSAGSLQLAWGLDDWLPPTRGLVYPAIPGLQQFARNLLADLLRPAAPLGVVGAPSRGGVALRVPASDDPRVQATEVFRGERLICRATAGTCSDPNLPGHRFYDYTAIAVDEWGRSEPAHVRVVLPNSRPTVRLRRAGSSFIATAADRGFGTSTGDAALARHRVRDPVIPRQQRPAPIEKTRGWRRRYRFRNGLEGRISQLKRKGPRRTRLRSLAGAQTWVGGIALAHNLQRMALLT